MRYDAALLKFTGLIIEITEKEIKCVALSLSFFFFNYCNSFSLILLPQALAMTEWVQDKFLLSQLRLQCYSQMNGWVLYSVVFFHRLLIHRSLF